MIKIRIRRKNKNIERIVVTGHSGYEDEGKDIVCAAVSALSIAIAQAIEKLGKGSFGQDKGYLSIELEEEEIDDKTNLLLETLTDGLISIYKEYPDFIEIFFE